LLVFLSGPCFAVSNADLKATAVVGTLSTWAFAWWHGANLSECADERWRVRLQYGKDKELTSKTLGAVQGECKLMQGSDASPLLSFSPNYNVTLWSAERSIKGRINAWDVAAIPMLHWRAPFSQRMTATLDFGIGISYLSESNIGMRIKGTNFQFSDHIGIGVEDLAGKWRAGIGYRHISNANISNPNNGVDFVGGSVEFLIPGL
jgi:hypothetical protein